MNKLIVGLVIWLAASPLAYAQIRLKIEETITEAELKTLLLEQRTALHDEAKKIVAEYPEKIKELPYGSADRKSMLTELANAKKFLPKIPKEETLFQEIKDGKKKVPATWVPLKTINQKFQVREVMDAQTFVGSKPHEVISGGGKAGITVSEVGNDYFVFKNWDTNQLKENRQVEVQARVIECRKVNWGTQMIPLFVRVPDSMVK